MLPDHAALLLIDLQQGFDEPVWGLRNNPDAEANSARLLSLWRAVGWPVIHVHHHSTSPDSPLRPGMPGAAPALATAPLDHEPVFTKRVNSAFIGTDLEAYLRSRGIDALVLVGLTANHCVSTSARMAGNLGFETFVVSDATAAFDRTGHDGQVHTAASVHAVSLANLHGEFATVLSSAAVAGALPARP